MIDLSRLEKPSSESDDAFDLAYAASVAYLKETDWQVIAMIERQRKVPEDVQLKRRQALDVVTSA